MAKKIDSEHGFHYILNWWEKYFQMDRECLQEFLKSFGKFGTVILTVGVLLFIAFSEYYLYILFGMVSFLFLFWVLYCLFYKKPRMAFACYFMRR